MSKTPSALLFLIRGIIVIKLHQEPLKLLIRWKKIKNQLSRSIPWLTLRRWIVMGIDTSSSFDPTQRLQSMGPEKDSNKDSEKLEESSMSGATSTRKALKVEVERGSTDSLLKNDFAKKPFKDESNKKLDASGDFPQGKVWKPVLKTDEIAKEKGMQLPLPFFFFFFFYFYFLNPPTFSNINVGVKSMITQHLNKENTRWVFIPNSSPDIWTGAGYRKANNNNNGIPFDSVKPSNNNQQFNPNSDDNKVNSKPTTYPALPNSISPTSDC